MVTNPFAAGDGFGLDLICLWHGRDKEPLTSEAIRSEEARIWTWCDAIITISRLRIPGGAAEDEIGIVVDEVAHAMVVSIQHNAVMLLDDIN